MKLFVALLIQVLFVSILTRADAPPITDIFKLNAENVTGVINATNGSINYIAPGTSGNFMRSNGSGWVSVSVAPGSTAWGTITGTLSAQTDLQAALDGKEPLITAGTMGQYWRGDKTFQTLNTTVVPEGSNLYFTTARAQGSVSATAPLIDSAGVFSIPFATTSVDGYLKATDFTIFNNKQSALSFVSPLVNTAGSVSLANTAVTPGSYSSANITVDAQGRLTFAQNGTPGGVTSVTASSPINSSGGATPNITCDVASGSQPGCLSSTDWSTFNGKQNTLSFGNLTDTGTDGITVTGGAGAVIGSGTSLSQHVSDSTHAGYLNSADWSTFNSKQPAGSYITALTGDVTASGPNSAVATISASSVTNAKLANMAGHTYKGNNTGSSSAPLDVTETQLTADLDLFTSSLQGLVPASGGGTTNFLRADGTFAAPPSSSGTVTSVALALPSIFSVSGSPVTSSGTLAGTLATQLANTVFAGPVSGGAATPAFRGLVSGDIPSLNYVSSVSGTAPVISSGGLTPTISMHVADSTHDGYLSQTDWSTFNGKLDSSLASANLFVGNSSNIAQAQPVSGDVIMSNVGAFTIANSAVTNVKLANMPANTFKGNNTGSSAAPLDLTGTQVTAGLDIFTSSLQGVVPNSGGGTTNFLRADGMWVPPSSITTGNLTDTGTDGIIITGGTGAVVGSGTSVAQHVSDATHAGYLSSSDWNTFNNKLDKTEGNYITNPDAEVDTSGWNLYNDTGRTVPASVTNQDITYTSALSGGGGNGNTISYTFCGSSYIGPVVTCPSGTAVQVCWYNGPTLADNPTATALKTAYDAVPCAVAIATSAITGTAGNLQYQNGTSTLVGGGDASPVDGTGGVVTGVTFTRNTSTPLIGIASFDLGKDGSSRQGMGVSTDFVIDSFDENKTLQISFAYSGSSGMTLGTNSDAQVFVYDISGAVLIPVTPLNTIAGPVSTNKTFVGTFNSTSNSNYRLIIHIATTSTTAWDLLLDSVTVNDQLTPTTPVKVPSVVLNLQPISGAVTDHMVVMWKDGATHWVPATIAGAALPSFGDDKTQLGFATNIVGATADIYIKGNMGGFSFGPFTGYEQYIDNTAGLISPLPSPFNDMYVMVGMAISPTELNIQFDTHVDLISNSSGVPIKGGLLSVGSANDGTGDQVVAAGTTGQFLMYNTGATLGMAATTPVGTAPIVYTAASHAWSCTTATNSVAGCMSAADHTGLHPAVTIGTANGLSLSTQALSLAAATTSVTGALTSTDWNTFNGKLTSPLTTKGDILGFSTVNARVPIGTNGQVLTADSTQTLGLKWATVSGTGTVTSVALALPSIFTVSGSPVTTTGTLTGTLATQTANTVFAGPTSGGVVAPTFRTLVAADIPSLPYTTSALTSAQIFVGNSSNIAQAQAVSGDLTASNTGAFTIANSAVTNAKMANMTAHTYKGNNTGSTAAPIDVTSTQLTADLNLFTSSLQGLTPSSGGGTTNFLRADGTWAAPSGGGGMNTNMSNMASPTAMSQDLTWASNNGQHQLLTNNETTPSQASDTMVIATGNSETGQTGAMSLVTGTVNDAAGQTTGGVSILTGGGSGTPTGALSTGAITLQTGTSHDSTTGEINFSTGSDDDSGNSGSIVSQTGSGVGSGSSGEIDLTSGNAGSGNSGRLFAITGTTTAGGISGDADWETGNTENAMSGSINLVTGTVNNPNSSGSGNVILEAGTFSGTPTGPFNGGNIILQAATGTMGGSNGVIQLGGYFVNFANAHALFQSNPNAGNNTAAPTANAGTGATCSMVVASDTAGVVTLTTTAVASSSGDVCDITFNGAFTSAPTCVFSPANSNAALDAVVQGVFTTTSLTQLSFNFANADVVGRTYIWNFHCFDVL